MNGGVWHCFSKLQIVAMIANQEQFIKSAGSNPLIVFYWVNWDYLIFPILIGFYNFSSSCIVL